jgi:hypothetical protein
MLTAIRFELGWEDANASSYHPISLLVLLLVVVLLN